MNLQAFAGQRPRYGTAMDFVSEARSMGKTERSSRAKRENGQFSREDWIEAAREALIRSGVDGVKVDRLAKTLQVTRGSFYWHFEDRKDLLDALLDRWEKQNRNEIAQVAARSVSGDGATIEVARIWLGEDPEYPVFDMSVRFWARQDKDVAALVHQIDNEWISLLQSMFDKDDVDPLESLARARIVYFHQIGYNALAMDETLDERLRLLPYYHKVLVGTNDKGELEKLARDVRDDVLKSANAL